METRITQAKALASQVGSALHYDDAAQVWVWDQAGKIMYHSDIGYVLSALTDRAHRLGV